MPRGSHRPDSNWDGKLIGAILFVGAILLCILAKYLGAH